MSEAIYHRGPDEDGTYEDLCTQLASRRLKIIDLNSGKQPIYNENNTMVIVFNGEVYNFKELREILREKKHRFHSESDTEVVLHAYEEWGEECLSKFRGMFAFCIRNLNNDELFLARDRLGIKPLYYSSLSDGTFIFGSEIKALLRYPGIEKAINVRAIDNLLTYGFNTAPDTFFNGIQQLLPGHYLKVSQKGILDREYWDIDLNMPLFEENEQELAANLRHEIEKSVKQRIHADVPVAAYLSGGLDSSTVTGLYSQFSDSCVKTISITFDEAGYDESEYSRKVSRFFGNDNIEFKCQIDPGKISDLIYHLEEPMSILLNLPLFLLSKRAEESNFKVVLSGDGADEIFGGYDYFKLLKAMHFIERHESDFRKNILRRIFPHIKTHVHAGIQHMVFEGYRKIYPALPYRFQEFPLKNELYSMEYMEALNRVPEENPFFFDLKKISHRSIIDQSLYIETKMRLLNLTLPLADKMSMANSVELRPMFLDHDLVNFIFRIPDKYKMRGLCEKYLLKKSMRGFLPDYICDRKKQPLQPPGKAFIDSVYDMVQDQLSEKNVKEKGYFNYSFIERVLGEYKQNNGMDNSGVVIVAFFVHLWDEIFLRN